MKEQAGSIGFCVPLPVDQTAGKCYEAACCVDAHSPTSFRVKCPYSQIAQLAKSEGEIFCVFVDGVILGRWSRFRRGSAVRCVIRKRFAGVHLRTLQAFRFCCRFCRFQRRTGLCHQVDHLLQPTECHQPTGLNIIRVHIVVGLAVVLPLFQLLGKNRDLIAFLQHPIPLVDAVPEVHAHKEALPFSGLVLCAAGFQAKLQHLLLPGIPEHRVFGNLAVQHDAVLGLDDHASSPPNGSSAFSSAEGAFGAGIRVPAVLR
nr:MAG TPA: hypothetical protein [Caudoviricetes sp.]